jgi:hypothetical protein
MLSTYDLTLPNTPTPMKPKNISSRLTKIRTVLFRATTLSKAADESNAFGDSWQLLNNFGARTRAQHGWASTTPFRFEQLSATMQPRRDWP